MIVCVCRRISDHQIRQAAAEGAVSLECLQFELGVATQCGRLSLIHISEPTRPY